jgi:hypothetical protein
VVYTKQNEFTRIYKTFSCGIFGIHCENYPAKNTHFTTQICPKNLSEKSILLRFGAD